MRGKRHTIAKLYAAIGSIEIDEGKSVHVRLENPAKLLEAVQPPIAAIANDIRDQREFVDETGVAHSLGPAPDEAALHALATAIGDATHGKVLVLATQPGISTVSISHP